jgi:hypothetical protein
MGECHKTISKYHCGLLMAWNSNNMDNLAKEELRLMRVQSFFIIKSNLEKLLPQIDQLVLFFQYK